MTYLDALQTTLAGEHAACYLLSYLGAQASKSTEPTLSADLGTAYDVHLARRDELQQRVVDAGGTPVASEPYYDLPDLITAAQLERRALQIEQTCATTYDYLVASSTGDDRRYAIGLLLDAALRALTFGGKPETLPGRS